MVRESGILMHISSLPGPYGIGTMGQGAFRFVDFLHDAGQRWWQILPLNPTGYGDSPYQSCSAFAGNPYLIDLRELQRQGLLEQAELDGICRCGSETRVDFGALYENRSRILRLAFSRFRDEEALSRFCLAQSGWLPDFALYMALKDRYGGAPWYEWPPALKRRDPDAVWQARRELRTEIRFYGFVQYLFFTQWQALRDYAHSRGVGLFGDVPIYVPYDSADVWSNPELFQLDDTLMPTAVAGCPPDAFSADGQLWGNPLYRWDELARTGYGWWLRRLEAAGSWYDRIRLDHFRGFESYWSVPYGDETARGGHWVKGPGMDFLGTVAKRLPWLSLVAEDLGLLTPEVLALRDESGLPGMKVLGFAFDSEEPSDYLPHRYPAHTVCYTGTHDNMTMRQWFETAPQAAVERAAAYMALTEGEGFVWGTIRTAFASVAELCMIPMQDYLNLGAEARMNFPGTMSGDNWTWRMAPDAADGALAERIRRMTRRYERLSGNRKDNHGVWNEKEIEHEL